MAFSMFESPFSSDFDFGTDVNSSSPNSFSLRGRLRGMRDALRGFKPTAASSGHTPGSSPSTTADRQVPSKKISNASAHSGVPSTPSSQLAGASSSSSSNKLVREVELALHFLQEVIRTERFEVLIGCTNALFDAMLALIASLSIPSTRLQDALITLLDWVEDKILSNEPWNEGDIRITNGRNKIGGNGSSDSTRLIAQLVQEIADVEKHASDGDGGDEAKGNRSDQMGSEQCPSDAANSSSCCSTSQHGDSQSATFSNSSTNTSESVCMNLIDQSLDELLAQLNVRQVAKFEPILPQMENDDSDDDDSEVVRERREERDEKKDTKTCEEEVKHLADGSEIRKRQTRTYNMHQNQKKVTVQSHGAGGEPVVNTFHDGDLNLDEDLQTDNFFTRPAHSRFGALGRHNFQILSDWPNNHSADDGLSEKTKTVQHSDVVSQKVAKIAKKNGKVIANDAAEKIDKSTLDAKQVETFQHDKLLSRRGSGSYEEQTVIKMGLTNSTNPSAIPPKQRHVVQYMQTFGGENDQDDFFKGSTLASYIVLNDNLRYHEEQYRKRSAFAFSLSGSAAPNHDYSDLSQLLHYSDHDCLRLPIRFIDADEVHQILPVDEKTAAKTAFEVLHCVDVTDWLLLKTRDSTAKPNEVRGGPKDALIAYATQPSGSLLYQEAFLTTYRGFVSSHELILKLIDRFTFMCKSSDQPQVKVARQTFSILVRVVDDLCAIELTEKLIRPVIKFVNQLVKASNFTFARILRKRLMSRMERKIAQLHKTIDREQLKTSRCGTIFDFRSSLIAKQMTYLDAELFQMIEVSYWVRTHVLRPKEQKMREKILIKFIKIMKHLRTMGNYNSYLAILSALDSGPIRRLDWSKQVVDLLREHSTVMDSSHSFKNYRTLLAESHPPCLPYIGLILQDLTFVHIGNNDFLPSEQCGGRSNLLNYGKRWQQFTILDSIRRFKSWNYSIEKDDKVLMFFNTFNDYLNEDEIWDLSESIKPRLRKNK